FFCSLPWTEWRRLLSLVLTTSPNAKPLTKFGFVFGLIPACCASRAALLCRSYFRSPPFFFSFFRFFVSVLLRLRFCVAVCFSFFWCEFEFVVLLLIFFPSA